MTRSFGLKTVYLFILGCIGGWCLFVGQVSQISDSPPPGWNREQSPVPYRQSALQGTQNPSFGEWGLDFYRAIYPNNQSSQTDLLKLTASIPKEGFLEVWFSSPPIKKRMGDRWMNICDMRLPRGHTKDPRCFGKSLSGTAIILSQLSEQSAITVVDEDIRGRTKRSCSPDLPSEISAKSTLEVQRLSSGIQIKLNGAEYQCSGITGDHLPMLRSGLRQVLISDVSVNNVTTAYPNGIGYWYLLIGGIFSLGLGFIERRNQASWRSIVITHSPLLLGIIWASIDSKVLIEDLRASWLSPYFLCFGLCIAPTILLKSISWSFRTPANKHLYKYLGATVFGLSVISLTIPQGWIGVLLGSTILVVCHSILKRLGVGSHTHILCFWGAALCSLVVLVDPFHWAGIFWGMIGGLMIGSILIVNRFTVPYFNWLSLFFFTILITSSEITLRSTKAGLQWSNKGSNTEHSEIFGWVRQANESFELFEDAEHTTYPDKGYPVAIPKSRGKKRIIAFGGSTTGGAFQNDNLDEFYPAKIEESLRRGNANFEVLNQGVGGWTTWHITAYAEQQSGLLNADVMTLYVGHNDILTSVPLPYKELYPLWQRRQSNANMGSTFGKIRLYQALRYGIVSLRDAENKVAVPVEDARENITRMIQQYPNTEFVLGSEGLSPDPGILFSYNSMLQDLAKQNSNVTYIPIAENLSQYPPHDIFLDDCHLTSFGHELVAKMFTETINQLELK